MVTNVGGRLVVLALAVATPAWAQEPAPAPRPVDRTELRHQIYVMEGALARAVEFGASRLNRELRTVAPEMFLLAGDAQARGVYLEGYGIFFDVAVPMLRQSMMWSLRMMLQQDTSSTQKAIADLRRHVQSETDPAERRSLESAIARLEAQASPFGVAGRARSGSTTGPGVLTSGGADPVAPVPPEASAQSPGTPAPAPSPADMPWLMDTNRVYTEAVQRALIDAMIDFSAPMNLGADEWLTVAARDSERRDTLAPQDPYEEVVTVLLRIRGADLREYRAGQIDKVEARKRVRVGEF
ncbi:MAG: hypothetical protein IT179_13175 [Acidobacteria bacterium]|nr:hypothetical protein [Acidobacteriota bacterium]